MAGTGDQHAELDEYGQRIYERLRAAVDTDLREMARLLSTKDDEHLLGATEYEIRDAALRVGAVAIEEAAQERQKKGRLRGC